MNATAAPARRSRRLAALTIAAFLTAGCARSPFTPGPRDDSTVVWRGRLALQMDSEPPRSFAASFELEGSAERGELRLYTPLGGTLAVLRWSSSSATLHDGQGYHSYESLDALAAQASGGAPIPVAALFDWLVGRDTAAPGWQADLTQLAAGRLQATRSQPPATRLRVVLER